jgi:hypothetical protein
MFANNAIFLSLMNIHVRSSKEGYSLGGYMYMYMYMYM